MDKNVCLLYGNTKSYTQSGNSTHKNDWEILDNGDPGEMKRPNEDRFTVDGLQPKKLITKAYNTSDTENRLGIKVTIWLNTLNQHIENLLRVLLFSFYN